MTTDPSLRYTRTAQSLHWLMALMIFGLLGLGFYMSDLPLSPDKLQYYAWHKWAGVSVFVLVWLRLAWRITHQPPTMPESMSVPLQWGAHAGHFLLYALMLCIPVSGWLMSSAKGFQTVWFGVLPIPDLIGKDKLLGENLAELHEALSIGLLLLIAGHTAAAFFHHFIHKDHTLQRMWPKR
jgi:cytochrome b561